ncbi:beta-1,6-N-acetylglucosaminyltransferase [Empedobacter falsenii]
MKKIILIQAHKDLECINDLINQLDYENFEIYLHIDAKSTININEVHPKARIVKNRININWGEFSQVEATLSSLKQINEEQTDYSHIILISGQDFPLKSNREIDEFLNLNLNENYIQYFLIPKEGKFANYQWRYTRRHYPKNEKFLRKINNVLIRMGIFNIDGRKLLPNYKYYSGSQWWILTKDAIEYVLKESTPKMLNYFKYVFCSDEMYFQILLLNSDKKFSITNDTLKFMKWEEFNHPKDLDINELDEIFNSPKNLFCRKISKGKSDLLRVKIKNRINHLS